jgi:hypothetical protein
MKWIDHIWGFTSILRDVIPFAIAAGAGVRYWLRTRKAQSWPSTQGTIISASAQHGQQGRRGWACALSYSYIANGEYYSGVHLIRARNEKRAEELASEWKGRSIVARYSPSDHHVSVLLKSDQFGGMDN